MDTSKTVARYRAIVGVSVESSELTLSPDLPREEMRQALVTKPEWCTFRWPEVDPRSERDLTYLALLRLRAFWDFGAGLAGSTAGEIQRALSEAFPELQQAEKDRTVESFMSIPVEARIGADGVVTGGYTKPNIGELPPLPEPTWDHLDRYVKNMVRLDIAKRVEAFLDVG